MDASFFIRGVWLVLFLLGCSPHRDEGVKVLVSAMPTTLDWNTSDPTSWVNFPVMLATQKGLTTLGADGTPGPGLASSWERSRTADGHERYVFQLRPDVTWSDGAPLEAADFVLGWERALHGREGYELADLEEFHAVNLHTLEVLLHAPRNYFLSRLANVYVYFPAPSHELRALSASDASDYFDHPRDGKPRSLGPFRVESWDRAGERVRLTRNPKSAFLPVLEPGEKPVQTITLLRSEVGLALFERKRVDFVPVDDAAALAGTPRVGLEREPLLSTYFLAFNTERSPLDDVRLRRFIAAAMDREALLQGLLPESRPSAHLVPGELPLAGAFEFPARRGLTVRPTRPLRLVYHAGASFIPEVAIAERIKAQLSALGISIELDARQDFSAELSRRGADGTRTFDLYLKRIGADYAHPNSFLTLFKPNGNHQTGWEHVDGGAAMARFAALLEAADSESDGATARGLYGRAEQLLLGEAAVIVPLYHPDRYFRRSGRVAGLRVDAFNFLSLGNVRWAAP